MLPNVLPSSTEHVPVLADEVREPPRREARRDRDRLHLRRRRPRGAASPQDLAGEGKLIAIDRDPGVRDFFDRFKATTGVQTRLLRGNFATVLGQLAANDVQADAILHRPRRLVDAARPAGAGLLVLDRRAARHADGPDDRPLREAAARRRAPSRSSPRSSAATARSASRGRSPARSSAAASSSRSSAPASSST